MKTLCIPEDHPSFAGHFPGMPILPGVVLLDETLRVLEIERGLDLAQWQITAAKFLNPVRPGDALTLEHESGADGVIRFTVRGAEVRALAGTLSRLLTGTSDDA